MLLLPAWVLGIVIGFFANIPSNDDVYPNHWWYGLVFGLVLFPAMWVLGLILPRIVFYFASGAMIGGAFSIVISIINKDWLYLSGGFATLLVGFFSAFGQFIRNRGVY